MTLRLLEHFFQVLQKAMHKILNLLLNLLSNIIDLLERVDRFGIIVFAYEIDTVQESPFVVCSFHFIKELLLLSSCVRRGQ